MSSTNVKLEKCCTTLLRAIKALLLWDLMFRWRSWVPSGRGAWFFSGWWEGVGPSIKSLSGVVHVTSVLPGGSDRCVQRGATVLAPYYLGQGAYRSSTARLLSLLGDIQQYAHAGQRHEQR